jgi:hypothetical protein
MPTKSTFENARLAKDDPVLEIHVALGGCFVFTYRRVYLRLEVRSRVAGGWLLEI